MTLGYLGPEGTFSQQAARDYDGAARHVAYPNIAAVMEAAAEGEVQEAVVPIENSLEGPVTTTTDLLIHHSPLVIRRELVVPIHHCLVIRPGTRASDVRVVYSHPQALAQCRGYLRRHLPSAEPVASLSTASSVADMLASRVPAAAISSRAAAEGRDVVLAEADIEDSPNNRTRFLVLARMDGSRTGSDKTSVCFDYDRDGPGTLHGTLGALATRGINMVKIESRPDKRSLGRYVFLVDMEGHRTDPAVAEALEEMRTSATMFKVLGSYPKAAEAGVRAGSTQAAEVG